jgi:hypothetical protein
VAVGVKWETGRFTQAVSSPLATNQITPTARHVPVALKPSAREVSRSHARNWPCASASSDVRREISRTLLQDEEPQRPAPLHASHPTAQACAAGAPAPGKRSQLVLIRSRADYGCVWTTYVRRTDAPVVFSLTRITRREVAAPRRGPQRGSRAGVPIAGRAFRLRTAAARSASRRPPRLLALHQKPRTI